MIKKFRYSARGESVKAATAALAAVLSIALFTEPQALLSQSNEDSLARGSMAVAEFYLQRENLNGAIKRFEYIVENYENFDDMDTVLHRLGELYERAGVQDPDVASAGWYSKVVEDYNSDKTIFPVQIHKVEPIYPETAKASGLSGDVMLRVTTDEEGKVVWASAIDGYPELAKAAITAVSQWRYEPAISSGENPAPVTFGVLIRFLPDRTVDSSHQSWGIYLSEDES